MSVIKKLPVIIGLTVIMLTGCQNQNSQQGHSIDFVIEQAIHKNQDCNDTNSTTFISYDLLGVNINNNENIEYYLAVNGQGYFLNERGDLSSSCGFTGIPTKIEIGENKNGYFVVNYQIAKNGPEYESSVRTMFSNEAYKNRKLRQRTYGNGRGDSLNKAEEYFGVKVDNGNKFDCKFCDITRYYHESDLDKQGKSIEIYSTEPIDNRRFIFKSDGTLQKMGSNDEGKYERHFGKDNLSVIIDKGNNIKTLERMIIENLKDNEMVFFTEYIQL